MKSKIGFPLLFTLNIYTFFFLCSSKTYALTSYNVSVNFEDQISYYDDVVKPYIEKYSSDNNLCYVVMSWTQWDEFEIPFYQKIQFFRFESDGLGITIKSDKSPVNGVIYYLNNTNKFYKFTTRQITISNNNNTLDFSPFMDSNCSMPLVNKDLTFNYNESVFTLNSGDNFLPVYKMFLKNSSDDNPTFDLSFIDSFYSIIIEKISFLSSIFLENPIFITCISIFIFYFLFFLIIRRFL